MNRSKKDVRMALGAIAIVVLFVVAVVLTNKTSPEDVERQTDSGTKEQETVKVAEDLTASRMPQSPVTGPVSWGGSAGVTPRDVDRLPARRIVSCVFSMSGKGKYSKWGRGLLASFTLTGTCKTDSTIVQRQKFGNGRFKVVEDVRFIEAREMLEINDADYFIALDTLPLDKLVDSLNSIGAVVKTVSDFLIDTGISGIDATGGSIKKSGEMISGVSSGLARFSLANHGKALKDFGVDLGARARKEAHSSLDDFSRAPKEVETVLRMVEKRTYRITYIQKENGDTLNVTAERLVDGKTLPLESEEEVWMLSRCNAFIDADITKNHGTRAIDFGEKWTCDAGILSRFAGVGIDFTGDVTCCCDGENEKGDAWTYVINPAELDILDGGKRKIGSISIGGGGGELGKDGGVLRSLAFKGGGKISRVDKYSLLYVPFNERFIGETKMGGSVIVEIPCP